MSENKNEPSLVPSELIASRILLIRNQKVMIDSDIAELYGQTSQLQAIVEKIESRLELN